MNGIKKVVVAGVVAVMAVLGVSAASFGATEVVLAGPHECC